MGYASETRNVTVHAGEKTQLDLEMGEKVIELEAFTVTGRLVGTAKALNQQKTSDSFSSIVASDAIGALPDENVAEALSRVPGISVERDQGEGRFVVIRGMDPELNNIEVNGVSLSAPENETRAIALDVIPSELIDSLEVTKVNTPDMDADAIGGTVDIKTRSPFDEAGQFLRVKSSLVHSDLRGELGGKAAVVWGDLFNDDTVGLTIAASYGEKKFASDNNEVDGPWVDEDGLWIPEEIEYREYNVTRERRGIDMALEFKPDADRYFYIKGLFSYFSDLEARYRVELKAEKADDFEDLTSTGVHLIGVEKTDRDLKDRFEEQNIMSLIAGGEQYFTNMKIDYSVAYSYANENEPDRYDTAFRNSDAPFDAVLDWSGDTIKLVSVGDGFADAAQYEFDELVQEDNTTDEAEISAQFNLRKDFTWGDHFGFTKFGVKYASKEKTTDLEAFANDDNPDSIANLALVMDSTLGRNTFNQGPRADQALIRNLYLSNKEAFAMERNDEDSIAGDYESTEDILAAYGMAAISWGNATLTAGLRVEKTDFETQGYDFIIDEEGDFVSADPITQDKSYTDFFPHLSLQYNFNEDTIGRVAITKTIARPRFKQTALRRLVNREDEEIETGNPDLDPFESWNFDASIEFYTQNLGVFSAAVFYKSIDNYVFDLASELEDPETGFDLITYLNGESAEIYGLEFEFRRELTFLPEPFDGLGFSANLTISDSSAKTDIRPSDNLQFIKHSDTVANIALYYEKGGFNFRVAGSYRSDYIDEYGEDASEDLYLKDHFQFDVTSSYQINDQWTVFAEMINMNNEPRQAYYGESYRLSQFEEYSWTATLGFKFNL